jgi:hypothetical protein
MNSSLNNPETNKLKAGISEADLEIAIIKSGYPLQTIIANKLRKQFYCQEEWSFIDNQTKDIRTLDIVASKELFEFNEVQPRVRPKLNLLVECKQSDLPYVFFLSPQKNKSFDYPHICGLFNKSISVVTDDDSSSWSEPIIHALGLFDHDFIEQSTASCMTFSKAVRSGGGISLSGTDGYNNLVLPLLKSLQHFDEVERPPKTAYYFDCHLSFAVGVIDGPMVGVHVEEDSHRTEFIPWVRVFRQESYDREEKSEREKLYAIDIVHKDFFED